MRCPYCGEKLKEVGYPDGDGYQRYECQNGCEFWKHWKWKLNALISYLIGMFIMIMFIIIVVPLAYIIKALIKFVEVVRK